jgi:hypothetical protein
MAVGEITECKKQKVRRRNAVVSTNPEAGETSKTKTSNKRLYAGFLNLRHIVRPKRNKKWFKRLLHAK